MPDRSNVLDLTHPAWMFLSTISRVADEAERARLTATTIPAVIPCDVCGVALLDDAEEAWNLALLRGGQVVPAGADLDQTLTVLAPVCESAFDVSGVLNFRSEHETTENPASSAIAHFGTREFAVVALRTVRHRVGAIFVARHDKTFSTDEEMLLSSLADCACVGFENARLTEQLQARAVDLRRSAEEYSSLYHNTPVMMHSVDDDGKLIRMNDHWLRILGYDRKEVLGKRSVEFLSDASRTAALEHVFPELRKSGLVREIELQMIKRDGTILEVLGSAVAQFDEANHIVQTLAFFVDVTDRKRAETALRESEQRFAGIFKSAMDAIVIIDADGLIKLFNESAAKVFRCSQDEVAGERFTKRFASGEFRRILEDCIRNHEDKEITRQYLVAPGGLTAIRADGETFAAEATVSQVDIPGQPLFAIVLRDIEERKRAEAALSRLRQETQYLKEEIKTQHNFDEIIGQSRELRSVLRSVETVAPTPATVLILGETGTGKELIARAIHDLSSARDRPLVKVNCAALPAGLIESELFGHERGAFTGALARKIGRFELADRGTIFLDEIGDLPLDMQAKLLRVLQEGEFERVGGTRTMKVNVRIIAATNRHLEQAVAEERFRADLYYRLNVFPVTVPALRERKDDIPPLVNYFVTKYTRKLGRSIRTVPDDVVGALVAYDWPGNIRELENVVERAVILTQNSTLELGGWLPRSGPMSEVTRVSTLDEAQRQHIVDALEFTNWQVSGDRGAAKLLGIKPTTLSSRMKKLGIERTTGGQFAP